MPLREEISIVRGIKKIECTIRQRESEVGTRGYTVGDGREYLRPNKSFTELFTRGFLYLCLSFRSSPLPTRRTSAHLPWPERHDLFVEQFFEFVPAQLVLLEIECEEVGGDGGGGRFVCWVVLCCVNGGRAGEDVR